MNTRNYYLSFLLLGCSVFMLSSCEKDAYDPSKAKVDKTTDLVVPDGFDWAMTRDVTLSMQSPVATSVSVYLDEKCEKLVAELPVEEGKSSMTLTVPSANSDLWIKYPINGGGEETQKIAIQKKAVTRDKGEAGSWTAESLFPDYAKDSGGATLSRFIYQPNKDAFGTIMFEDMWPEKGDYDLNDFVVNYYLVTTLHQEGNDTWVQVDATLKLRAMGGDLPYRFCIQLGNKSNSASMQILRDEVRLEDIKITNNDFGGGVELLDATHAIIALTGFENLKGKTGGNFYNTEQGHLIQNSATPVITFRLKIRPNNEDFTNIFNGFSNAFAFDYFLQNTENGREIHFIDYPPTELYKNYSTDAAGRNEKTYYCSSDNFVWALKAPVEMGWDVEKADIVNVYPEFVQWVQYGGDWIEDGSLTNSNREWYNRPKTGGSWIDPTQH